MYSNDVKKNIELHFLKSLEVSKRQYLKIKAKSTIMRGGVELHSPSLSGD